MATAASRTTNPLLLAITIAVVGVVVSARRDNLAGGAPTGFTTYLTIGLVVIGIRVVFRVVLDSQRGEHILFNLPEVPLPAAARGIAIGGAVSAEGLLSALYDGMRLATLVICVASTNLLANPKRLLKAVPGALHEVGVAVTVALTFAPQLVESARRVRRAQGLRHEPRRRLHLIRRVLIPVLTDALDRSLHLAASMDSRGYGRTASVPHRSRVLTGTLVLAGLGGICVGTYGLLDSSTPRFLGAPVFIAGLAAAVIGFIIGGRRVRRTRYRPDPWRLAEWLVAGSGVAVGAVMFIAESVDPSGLVPRIQPLAWPLLPALATAGILAGLLPARVAPTR
jgi:energy-coupling factor transport system permease protein